LGGYWEEVLGVCASVPTELALLCFFFTAVLPSVAAFAGATTGTAADAIANMAIIKSLRAGFFMHFSRLAERPFDA
jgi:hypothetical protein